MTVSRKKEEEEEEEEREGMKEVPVIIKAGNG